MKTIDLELAGKRKKASYLKFIKNFGNYSADFVEKQKLINILLPKAKRLVKLGDTKLQLKHSGSEYYSIMLSAVRVLNKTFMVDKQSIKLNQLKERLKKAGNI
jgi:hypothetical protein